MQIKDSAHKAGAEKNRAIATALCFKLRSARVLSNIRWFQFRRALVPSKICDSNRASRVDRVSAFANLPGRAPKKMPDNSISFDGPSQPVRFGTGQTPDDVKPCSAEETVKAIYRQVLKREADATGFRDHVRSLLDGTRTVQDLVRDLLHSQEWKSKFIDDHNVPEILLALYSCALARAPDRAGWKDFLAFGAHDDWSSVMDAFVKGSEYTERFGNDTVPGQNCQYMPKASTSGSIS
jgi:hypothetical protein